MNDLVFIAPLRVKPETKASLEAIAKSRTQSVADVIRDAIDRLIAVEKQIGGALYEARK